MTRAAVGWIALSVLAAACGDGAAPLVRARDAGGHGELLLTSVAPSERAPWLPPPDPLDQAYPAFGLVLYHMVSVYEAPRRDARPLGYLRRGARFRASEEVSREGCTGGWFQIVGAGYVCHGDGVLVDSRPLPSADGPALPTLAEPLPYRYMKTTTPDVPQYVRLPTPEDELATKAAFASVPTSDAGTAALPAPVGALLRARMQPGFYVSVDREVVDEPTKRRFLRTIRSGMIRADQLIDAKLPHGMGVSLGGHLTLPIAFVYRAGAPALRRDPIAGELVKAGFDLPLHAAFQLTGETVVRAGRRYFVTSDGILMRDTAVRVIDRVPRPKHTGKQERWIRVDLDRQTLTAYEGDRPVFATLISSGLSDHPTPAGVFRLHAKHVATTMADSLAADGPYSIEDVPWTMYFLGSYALHAAFWHDRFGHPRSHGCVNLAPRDARWLFFWTAPDVPSGWHGAFAAVGKGTVVTLDTGSLYAIEQPR